MEEEVEKKPPIELLKANNHTLFFGFMLKFFGRLRFFIVCRKWALALGVVINLFHLTGYGPALHLYVGPVEFRLEW